MAESGVVENVGSILDVPACIADRQHTRPDIQFGGKESDGEFIITYEYDQMKGDHEQFDLLHTDSPEKGVYARFMVKRSDSNKAPHVLHFSSLIPEAKCKVIEKKRDKKKGYYEVILKKESKTNEKLIGYFKPKRPSSSDEEK